MGVIKKKREMNFHPGGNPGANIKSVSHRCYLREVAIEWELTKETLYLPLGCLQGGSPAENARKERVLGSGSQG